MKEFEKGTIEEHSCGVWLKLALLCKSRHCLQGVTNSNSSPLTGELKTVLCINYFSFLFLSKELFRISLKGTELMYILTLPFSLQCNKI